MVKLVTSLSFSRLDYCNAVLAELPISSRPYHLFSAFRTQQHDSSLSSVHVITWLPRCAVFTGYQRHIALPTNSACWCTVGLSIFHNRKAQPYITDTVTATSGIESRSSRRSASSDRYIRDSAVTTSDRNPHDYDYS